MELQCLNGLGGLSDVGRLCADYPGIILSSFWQFGRIGAEHRVK